MIAYPFKKCVLFSLALIAILHTNPPRTYANEEGTNKILDASADFSSFSPVDDPEDAYIDESFMYFDSDFNISIGTSIDFFSKAMKNAFGSSFPSFNFRIFYFFDQRDAIQVGFTRGKFLNDSANNVIKQEVLNIGKFQASPGTRLNSNIGALELEMLRYELGYKHYWMNGMPQTNSLKNPSSVWSPNFYTLFGIDIYNFGLAVPRFSERYKASLAVPTFAAGMDASLRDRHSSLALEARFVPTSIVSSDFGNFYSLSMGWIFLF